MKRFFFFFMFLALLLVIAGIWSWQQNRYSKGILRLEVIAPSEVTMGEEITYTVRWKNNGNTSLENPTLVFEYPQGSLPTDGEQTRITESLTEIYPGQEQTRQFNARLFGKEGEVKEAKAFLNYSPKNLSARFESETKGTSVITFVPLNFELDLPSRTESDQQFQFALNYFSNSEFPLANLRIKIEYPSGFAFKDASPRPLGENEWKVGVLNKAEGGRISIRGTLQGKLEELKVFKATLGSWKEGEFTLLKEVTKGIAIAEPQLQITQLINGNDPSVVSPGDLLHYEIQFKNVSGRNLENLFLIVNLEGKAYDYGSLRSPVGLYQSGDNSIVWEARDVPKLRFLGRGDTGKVEFWIHAQKTIEQFSLEDKNLLLRTRVVLSDLREEFDVKVNSRLSVNQKAFYQDEVFGNQGPLPPRVGERTTYTVVWEAQNLFNDVKGAKVKAFLPANAELTGKVFPENSSLTFDSVSREVVWLPGDLNAGTGTISPSASVAFQIALTPSSVQFGGIAQLMGQVQITGDDIWTVQTLFGTDLSLDTTLPDDSSSQGKGIVQ
ncbi:MAG: hypothetical protein A2842_02820 [Candidatus Wildermuthbacteria bacterium RIFCSPHIGHO2_01_FULL_48_25]|uniref:DUF11 domain-containing protein n=1 Tax=Candidatus Wildermuthbacteria bacterium RIFCSPLOWO2_01_FULL_48_16 TaxID=1802461 RepID=A0A1G2RJM0_9BACT|nr:MAG: hypothetical protein A2842_02820 [Candidatus Wildermuthbacteria bacterium RIFCSPHIGHO2_01_FULL_48_25]OHA73034.1 MAG: hypothetical protein A3B24_01305 [Candidatus Wildermuthbacteria bacterium RIFCSPLOWO2_01_FULL_48_16]